MQTPREENITSALALRAASQPKALAIVTDGETINYATLQRWTLATASHLQAQGIGRGDCVALVFDDEVRLAVGFLALARLGATAMPIPRSTTPLQRDQWARQAGAVALLSDLSPAAPASVQRVPFDLERIAARIHARDSDSPFDAAPTAPLMVIVGSGTTGGRKLIPVSHSQMRFRSQSLVSLLTLTPEDRTFTASHLEYASALHRLLTAISSGGAFVLPDRNTADLDALRNRYGVSVMAMTVFHLERILNQPIRTVSPPLLDVRVSIASSTVSDELRRRAIKSLGCRLFVHYGTNEAWNLSAATPADVLAHPGTVGKPVPGACVEVVDPAGVPVPPGEVGTVRVRSPGAVDRYLGDEESTREAFRDGWFYPNDLGRFTPDGHLIFCGRSDDMMIFNGVNIAPLEIESCLLSHPSVAEATAFPLQHPVHQDVPVAVVSLRRNAPPIDEASLLRYCEERLGFRRPYRVAIVRSMPRNAQGKLIRDELRKIIAALIEARPL